MSGSGPPRTSSSRNPPSARYVTVLVVLAHGYAFARRAPIVGQPAICSYIRQTATGSRPW